MMRVVTIFVSILVTISAIITLNTPGSQSTSVSDMKPCVQFEDQLLNIGQVDLNTGGSFGLPIQTIHPLQSPSSEELRTAAISPNKAHVAYTVYDKAQDTASVYLKDTYTLAQKSILVRQHIHPDTLNLAWSPDGQRLAYTWQIDDGSIYLSIVDAPGHEQKIDTLQVQMGDEVALNGWSADGVYLAVSIFNSDKKQRTITVWSITNLTRVKTISENELLPGAIFGGGDSGTPPTPFQASDYVRWGARDNWLAYLSSDAEHKFSAHLLSIGTHQEFTFAPSFAIDDQVLRWSPNGEHIAIISLLKDQPVSHLAVLGIDGKAYSTISDEVLPELILAGGMGWSPEAAWSADGRTFFYAQKRPEQQANWLNKYGDLFAFEPERQHTIMVQSNIYMNPHLSIGSRFLTFKWSNPDNESSNDYVSGSLGSFVVNGWRGTLNRK